MNKKNSNYIFWIAAFFPIHLLIDDYKRLNYVFYNDERILDAALNNAVVQNYLYIQENRVYINETQRDETYNNYSAIDSFQKCFFLKNLSEGIINLFAATKYSGLCENFSDFIQLDSVSFSMDDIKNMLDNSISQIFSYGKPDSFFDEEMVRIFMSPLLSEKIQIAFINVLYKYNQNKHAISYYNYILNKNNIDNETLLKISSAFFMTGDTISAQKILDNIKSSNSNNLDILTAVKIVELMNKFESATGKIEECNLLNEFREITEEVSKAPKNANLLLKISSSILSHEDAINLMVKSDLGAHIVQTYNNIGALYLTEGYKKYLLNQKDTQYLKKAEKYLNFAELLRNDKNEYSPYLELNKVTLCFCNKYRKKALNPSYKTLYNNYGKLIGKADSIYFKSIILCNCFILAKLLNYDAQTIQKLATELNNIKSSTQDFKIHEKIDDFMAFTTDNRRLPLWIITESHY